MFSETLLRNFIQGSLDNPHIKPLNKAASLTRAENQLRRGGSSKVPQSSSPRHHLPPDLHVQRNPEK